MYLCSGVELVHPWQAVAQACAGSGYTAWLAFGNQIRGTICRIDTSWFQREAKHFGFETSRNLFFESRGTKIGTIALHGNVEKLRAVLVLIFRFFVLKAQFYDFFGGGSATLTLTDERKKKGEKRPVVALLMLPWKAVTPNFIAQLSIPWRKGDFCAKKEIHTICRKMSHFWS